MKTLLLGDICPTWVTAPLFKKGNVEELFTDVMSIFKNKDFVFANLECALTGSNNAIKKFGPNLKAPVETAEVMKKIGITCVGLSNNHIFDFGKEGYSDTKRALENSGLDYTGFGQNLADSRKNYIFEHNGEKIAIIAVCEHEYSYALDDRMGARPFDEFETLEDIREAKKICDRVIVIYHGGKEYCCYPSPRLHRLCHAMARSGADVILGQHSHCISTYEYYNDCHILYGQGNFHFVKPSDYEVWYTSFAVEYDTVTGEIDFIPVCAEEHNISLAKGEKKAEIMSAFRKRCEQQLNGEWKEEWHRFCVENNEKYLRIIKEACLDDSTEEQNGLFSHFLDCEAHTDVWRELFPSYNLFNEK